MKAFPESDHGPCSAQGLRGRVSGSTAPGTLTLVEDTRQPDHRLHPRIKHSCALTLNRSFASMCAPNRSAVYLESTGANETYGFASFFAAFIRLSGLGKREHDTEQFPVIMRAENEVHEIPRSYLDHVVSKHESRTRDGSWRGPYASARLERKVSLTPYVMRWSRWDGFTAFRSSGKPYCPCLYVAVDRLVGQNLPPIDRHDSYRP